MSQREFAQWAAYVEEYGELSPARMYDRGHAQTAWMLQALQGGKSTLADFLPFHKPHEIEVTGPALEAGLLAQFSFTPKES